MAQERRKIYTGIIRTLQNMATTEKMVIDELNTRLQSRKIAAAATRFEAINKRLSELLKEAEELEQQELRSDAVKEATAIQAERTRTVVKAPKKAAKKAPKKAAKKKATKKAKS